jgi:thioesterase domain-containing protein
VDTHAGDDGDKRLVAYLVAGPRPVLSAGELRAFLKRHLPDYMLLAAFVWLDALPLLPNGKVDRRALPAASGQPAAASLPPRTTLHLQLVQIWEDLLPMRPIGIRDDFFALGGHSLLAARMIDRIAQVTGTRLPLATLFAGATVEGLAEALLQQEEQAPASQLVEIQRGDARPPFFFLHGDWLGGGFYCRPLAYALGEDQPFYVLQPHGLQGTRIPAAIERMAAELVTTLQAFQPHGPYLLGGYCNGGLVAYEMAQQLRAQGEEVRLLAMIDTVTTTRRHGRIGTTIRRIGALTPLDRERQLQLFLRARHMWTGFLKPCLRLQPPEQFTPAQQRAAHSVAQLNRALAARRGRARVARAVLGALFPPERALREESWAIYRWVMTHYAPARYAGRLTVIATEGVASEAGDARLGWGALARAVDGAVLPCSHLACVTNRVDLLAAQLREALERSTPSRQPSGVGRPPAQGPDDVR